MNPLFGNAVNDYYVELLREKDRSRRQRLAALKSKNDALAYCAEVRRKIRTLLVLPSEKTPLNPQITGTLDFPSFTMEKLVFESRPHFFVTANFYLPKNRRAQVPGILFLCGHSPNGKSYEAYQLAVHGLAAAGFAVIVADPISQGERLQFLDVPGFQGNCCIEHNLLGRQLELSGDFFGSWRIWDAIRTLDYLLGRPEVDSSRVGVTGTSGGGTLTAWINAVDDRLTMTVPVCSITKWLSNAENELPVDHEQLPPGALAAGLDMGDFLLAAAPRPLMILSERNDYFDPRGAFSTFEEIKRIYTLSGAGNAVEYFMAGGNHSYSSDNRQKMYDFFCRISKSEPMKSVPEFPAVPDAELWAAPGGQVKNIFQSKSVRDFALERTQELVAGRQSAQLPELRAAVLSLLNITTPIIPHFRVLRPVGRNGVIFSRFGLETEPGRVMSVLKRISANEFFHPEPDSKKITLYLPHLDSQDELLKQKTVDLDSTYGLDFRGIGECTPTGCDQWEVRDFFHLYQFDYHYAALGDLVDKPYLGGKVWDILCAVELLGHDGIEIHIEACGQGGVPGLLAAIISDKITGLRLIDGPDSWESMVRDPLAQWPRSCRLFDVLAYFDLPTLRKALGNRVISA